MYHVVDVFSVCRRHCRRAGIIHGVGTLIAYISFWRHNSANCVEFPASGYYSPNLGLISVNVKP